MSDTAQSPESGSSGVPLQEGDTGGSTHQEGSHQPATEEQIKDLMANGVGSAAPIPKETRPEHAADNPDDPPGPETTPGEPLDSSGPGGGSSESFEKTPRPTAKAKGAEREEPPSTTKPRRTRLEKGVPPAESPRARPSKAERAAVPKPAPVVPPASGVVSKTPPLAEPAAASETSGTEEPPAESPIVEESAASATLTPGGAPPASEGWAQEAALRSLEEERERNRADADRDLAQIDREAQAHRPPTAEPASPLPSAEKAAPEPATTPAPAPEVAKPPRPENKLEEQVEERYKALTVDSELKYSNDPKKVPGKVTGFGERVYPDAVKIKTVFVQLPDKIHEFPEWEVKEIIRDNLSENHRIAEEKAAASIKQEKADQQAAERAAREASKVARERKLTEERTAKEAGRVAGSKEEAARREAFEKEKTERSESFNQRLEKRLDDLTLEEPGATKLQRGKQTLIFERWDSSISNPYKFKDEKGQTFYLSEAEVNKLLAEKMRSEDKAALEQLKPKHEKEKPVATEEKGAKEEEKPTPKWRERLATAGALAEKAGTVIKKGAEATPVTRVLYDITNRFLNKFDYRDKDLKAYLPGIALGTVLTLGIDQFIGFLGFGPSSFIRSAISSGVIIAGSAGVNIKRNGAAGTVLENYGVKDDVERKSYIRKFDAAFRLLRMGDEGNYHEAMRSLSNEIFSKYGTANHKGNVEYELTEAAAAQLQKTIESLNTKYQKLNNTIRSFSAGLVVGTVGTRITLDFLWPKFESLFERIHGGGHEVGPAPGIEHTATPTPTPGAEVPGRIPTPGEMPQGVNPEAWHVFQSLPHDQQARLTEIASDPAKLDAFNHWIAAHEAIPPGAPEVPTLAEITTNPDLFHPTHIAQDTSLGKMLVATGHEVTWRPTEDADELFSAILANDEVLEEARRRALEAGLASSPIPTVEQLVNDWIAAKVPGEAGAAAFARGVDAAHWIPAGGELNIPTPEGIEVMKNLYDVR